MKESQAGLEECEGE